MSTPGPTPSNGLQSAQQQLDELDVLIQRMLTLPGGAAEDSPLPPLGEAPPVPEPPAPEPELPPLAEAPAFEVPALETPGVDAPPELPPLPDFTDLLGPMSEEAAAAEPGRDEAPLVSFEFGHDGIETSDYLPVVEVPPPAPAAADEAATLDKEDDSIPALTAPGAAWAEEPPPVLVQRGSPRRGVLIRCNQAFDRWTYPLGTTGVWLRSVEGRDILGWLGLALLMVALVWGILDWMGWIW